MQEQIVALRDQIARGSATETRVATLKEKINVQNSLVSELRGRLKSMEEAAEKKDTLIKDWNCAIDQFEKEIQRVSEENHKFVQERELMRSALNHVFALLLSLSRWFSKLEMTIWKKTSSSPRRDLP